MLALLLLPILPSLAWGYCPPTGPVLPPPAIPKDFKSATLQAALEGIAKGTAAFNSTATSFSFSVTSANATFLEFHHTAPVRNASGVAKVDGNTVYRVASNTKMYMALATLLEFPNNLDDPIGRYVPELAGKADYDGVTLRMLAGHRAGVPRNGYVFDRYIMSGPQLEKLGFPTPAPAELPPCDYGAGARACSREEFFAGLVNDSLTNPPGQRAAYSNEGYNLLGFALQGKANKSYEAIIRDDITGPLGLKSTSFVAPPASKAAVPAGQLSAWYDLDISHYKATAGLYSTPSDLALFLRSILGSRLLSPARTREWLQPGSFTSDAGGAVGMPWEIFRVPVGGRPVDLYTKSGDLPGYAAYAVLVPEYGVGATINAAGAAAYRATALLLDLVAAALVPELEALARRQAQAAYAGRYATVPAANRTADELVLAVDAGPGLKIDRWTSRGLDVFAGLALITGAKNTSDLEARLYPVGDGGRWRMVVETPASGKGVVARTCDSWMKTDQFRYGGLPVDEFDFETDGTRVKAVKALGLRQTFVKKG